MQCDVMRCTFAYPIKFNISTWNGFTKILQRSCTGISSDLCDAAKKIFRFLGKFPFHRHLMAVVLHLSLVAVLVEESNGWNNRRITVTSLMIWQMIFVWIDIWGQSFKKPVSLIRG